MLREFTTEISTVSVIDGYSVLHITTAKKTNIKPLVRKKICQGFEKQKFYCFHLFCFCNVDVANFVRR